MKNEKNFEKLLNKMGFELAYEKYGYYNCVPVAVKNIEGYTEKLKIFMIYDITNYDTNSSTIDSILAWNLTKKEIENVINQIEYDFRNNSDWYNYTNVCFGQINVRNGKIKRMNYIN